MKIIQIGHRKRQGKDTFAQMLADYIPNTHIMPFASIMKHIVYEAMDVTFDQGEELKNNNALVRGVLQRFGSGAMKHYFGKDIWKRLLLENVPNWCEYLIIPDFRFPEEYIEGSLTIKVHRDENYDDAHESETALRDFKFDRVILNDGTIQDLEDIAYALAKEILNAE